MRNTRKRISRNGEHSVVILAEVNDGLELGNSGGNIRNDIPEFLTRDILSELLDGIDQTISIGSTVF